MSGWKRRVLGITVISAGVCAALPFRNEGSNPPRAAVSDVGDSADTPPREELSLRLTIPAAPRTNSSDLPAERQPPAAVAVNPSNGLPRGLRRDDLEAPPSIAATFEPFATSVEAESPVAARVAPPRTPPEVNQRLHQVKDGDTIEMLAERDLGDRDRWPEIFEANAGVLVDPTYLPIGKELVIRLVPESARDADDSGLVAIPPELFGRD